MGVAYRAEDIADTRHSPSQSFVEALRRDGATVLVREPLVAEWPELRTSVPTKLPDDAAQLDAIVIAVPHRAAGPSISPLAARCQAGGDSTPMPCCIRRNGARCRARLRGACGRRRLTDDVDAARSRFVGGAGFIGAWLARSLR